MAHAIKDGVETILQPHEIVDDRNKVVSSRDCMAEYAVYTAEDDVSRESQILLIGTVSAIGKFVLLNEAVVYQEYFVLTVYQNII